MKRMTWSLAAAVVVLAATAVSRADVTHTISSNSYAAIAFSPKTGKYGYAYDCSSKAQAERIAMSHCPEPDAEIVGWVKFGWVVLAIGEDNSYGVAWEYGDGAESAKARDRALAELKKRGGKLKTYVRICSGDVEPYIVNYR